MHMIIYSLFWDESCVYKQPYVYIYTIYIYIHIYKKCINIYIYTYVYIYIYIESNQTSVLKCVQV